MVRGLNLARRVVFGTLSSYIWCCWAFGVKVSHNFCWIALVELRTIMLEYISEYQSFLIKVLNLQDCNFTDKKCFYPFPLQGADVSVSKPMQSLFSRLTIIQRISWIVFKMKTFIFVHKKQPGLDFIKFLHTAIMPVVPQRVRTQSCCQYLFYAFGICARKSCT